MLVRAVPLLALLLLGCDVVSAVRERVVDGAVEPATRAAPEGWESLEDESASLRLFYQFVDARGQVRFVETLDDVPEALRATVGFVKMEAPPPLSPGDAARARAAQLEKRGPTRVAKAGGGSAIVLYSAEWCGACKKAKRYLSQRGVDYEVRDIDQPRWADELLRRTGQRAIPVLDVGGRILTGFSAKGYDRLIERA